MSLLTMLLQMLLLRTCVCLCMTLVLIGQNSVGHQQQAAAPLTGADRAGCQLYLEKNPLTEMTRDTAPACNNVSCYLLLFA